MGVDGGKGLSARKRKGKRNMKNEAKLKVALNEAAALKSKIEALGEELEKRKNFLKDNLPVGEAFFAGNDKALVYESTRKNFNRKAFEAWFGKKIPDKFFTESVSLRIKING